MTDKANYSFIGGWLGRGLSWFHFVSLGINWLHTISQLDFTSGGTYKVEFRTFDGLIVQATLLEREKETWARFEAAADPAVTAPEKKENAKGLKSAEEVAEEVAAVNARVGAWAYRLSDYKAKVMKTRVADLLETEPSK